MTSLFTNSEQILSYGESRDDDLLGQTAGGCDGIATEAGQVVAVSVGDFLDEAEVAQASQVTDDAGCGQGREKRFQTGAAHATDVELRTLREHSVRRSFQATLTWRSRSSDALTSRPLNPLIRVALRI